VFELINLLAQANIDAFEDESITDTESFMEILRNETLSQLVYDTEIGKLLKEILNLFTEALNRKTGVFFYF
jgi:stalled ribosome rescue protein Dom34